MVVRAVVIGWLATAFAFASTGVLRRIPVPPPAIAIGLTLAALILLRLSTRARQAVQQLGPGPLVLFHVVRAAAGAYFLVLGARGVLPREFTTPAGWGDILVGVAAIWVLLRCLPAGTTFQRVALFGWNVAGLLDILAVVANAIRLYIGDARFADPFMSLPLALLPTFVVPIVIVSHILLFNWARVRPRAAAMGTAEQRESRRRGRVWSMRKTGLVILLALAAASIGRAQTIAGTQLIMALQKGGYVIVMRHASSPGAIPSAPNPDNVPPERQLDEKGRATASAMGAALRRLKIPIGRVQTSPTYRARETARLAGLPNPTSVVELGEGAGSMKGAERAQAEWLRRAVQEFPRGTNTVLVTHVPNVSAAFPDVTPAAAEGEALVFGPDGKGGARLVGRIKIEEWPGL